jgi:hypothetical protein
MLSSQGRSRLAVAQSPTCNPPAGASCQAPSRAAGPAHRARRRPCRRHVARSLSTNGTSRHGEPCPAMVLVIPNDKKR